MPNFTTITKQYFSPDGNPYSYWVVGKTENPPIILLYGYTGVHEDFLALAETLKNNYFVIIPEYPGWNNVPRFKAKLTIHNYAQYFKALLDSLNIQKSIIIAHCMGSVIAIEFAYLYPYAVSKLILISPPYLRHTWAEKMYLLLAHKAKHASNKTKPLYFFWRSRLLTVPLDFFIIKTRSFSQKMDRIKDHIINQPKQNEDAVEEEWISFIDFNFEKAKNITAPVHIIHGEKDAFIPILQAEKLRNIFSSATLDIIPNAGHVPPVETPNELAQLISKYLHLKFSF